MMLTKIGFLGGGVVYWIICLISPPPGKPYDMVMAIPTLVEGEGAPSPSESSVDNVKGSYKDGSTEV